MNIITRIIFFLIIVFILNIITYYISEDYNFFIKKIKNSNEIVYTKTNKINDEIIIPTTWNVVKKNKITTKEIVLWKNYTDIINAFSKYKMKKLKVETSLFDLTDEYPDNYYEYYSKELTIYLFTTKSYEEVKDIIKVISYEVPYEINEVNNFLDKSFYINLKKEIKDNNIRLVVSKKNITFWLKIKKNVYNDIKKILNKMKREQNISIIEKTN